MLTTKQLRNILLAMQRNSQDPQAIVDNISQAFKSPIFVYDANGNVICQSSIKDNKLAESCNYQIPNYYYSVAEPLSSPLLQANHFYNNIAYLKSSGIIRGTIVAQKQSLTLLEKTLLEMAAGIISLSIK